MIEDQDTAAGSQHRVVIVTGVSGAGRSTTINALEDFGYEAIDNLPLSLIPRLLSGPPLEMPLALGVDTRNREFSPEGMLSLIAKLAENGMPPVEVVYLDCRPEVLVRRFSETRRRHPMAQSASPEEGIAAEIGLLAPVRALADLLIDTSDLTQHDLRDELGRWLKAPMGEQLSVSIQSFSYKREIPRGLDIVLDTRFLRNPHWEAALRDMDGRSNAVSDYVQGDARFAEFFCRVEELVEFLLPAFEEEGKSHLSIGFGCTGGQHRSVAVAEKLANALAKAGWQVSIKHRELIRRTGVGGKGFRSKMA